MNVLDFVSLDHALSLLGINANEHSKYFSAQCPSLYHTDKNPSWVIYKDTGHFVCFSCGYKGSFHKLVRDLTGKNAYEFFQIENVESYFFQESLKDNKKRDSFPIAEQKGILSILGKTYDVYSNNEVYDYLESRSISEDFVNYYQISYCKQILINNKTAFIDRICIPIYFKGQLVNIEGRDFTHKSDKKVLYPDQSLKSILFDYDRLKKNEPLIVVEGIMDLPKLFNLGYRNITCTFGVGATEEQIKMISEFDEIWLFSDGDKAGREMISRFDEYLDKEFYVVRIEGKDPGEATEEEIKLAIKKRLLSVEFLIDETSIFLKDNDNGWRN